MTELGKRVGLLLETKLPILVIIGGVLVGIIGNGLYEIFRSHLGSPLLTVIAGILLIPVVIWFVGVGGRLRNWCLARIRTSPEIRASVPRRKGLIALVSPEYAGGRQAVDEALAYHLLDEKQQPVLRHCWLIAGPGTGDPARQMISSREKAERIRQELEQAGTVVRILHMERESAADDPLTTKALVERAFAEAGAARLGPNDIIADYTGGTKTMTAGMILACARPDRALEFMKPRRYKPDGTADRASGSEPCEVSLAFTTLSAEEASPARQGA